jgi:2'-5' RNA ligase
MLLNICLNLSKTDSQRLFFALVPGAQVRHRIEQVQLQMGATDARRVPGDNFHITLAFLGQVQNNRQGDLLKAMSQVALPPCELYLECCGWFKRPRVGWIGTRAVPEPVLIFQSNLAETIREHGFELDDRPWKPHITVYRKMRMPPVKVAFEPIRWEFESYSLMVSESRPGGVQYRNIGHRMANG